LNSAWLRGESVVEGGMPARRKSPWSGSDVQSCLEGLRRGGPRAPGLASDPLERIAQSRSNLAAFWAAKEAGFREMWAGLQRRDRAMLVQTICPHIARSVSDRICACGCGVDMTGSATLIPEIILERLVNKCGDGSLPDVMHRQATADHLGQEDADLMYLRQYHRPGQIPSTMYMMMDIAGLRRGQSIDVKHAQALPGVAKMLDTGMAIDDTLFDKLCARQLGLLGTLCAYADEYVTEWTKATNVYAVSAPIWAAPKWREKTKEQLVESFNRLQTSTRHCRARPGPEGVAAAEQLCAQGNAKFSQGDNRGACRLYSSAIDDLHNSFTSNASMSQEVTTMLHTCLSNRQHRQANAQLDISYSASS
jgi:hypothetical protein